MGTPTVPARRDSGRLARPRAGKPGRLPAFGGDHRHTFSRAWLNSLTVWDRHFEWTKYGAALRSCHQSSKGSQFRELSLNRVINVKGESAPPADLRTKLTWPAASKCRRQCAA